VKSPTSGANVFGGAKFSSHARRRTRQRGVRDADLVVLLFGADREAPVGGGCVALSISNRRRRELLAEGYPRSTVDRAARIAAVESSEGEIVTVLRSRGHRGRRYRRGPLGRFCRFVLCCGTQKDGPTRHIFQLSQTPVLQPPRFLGL
jgi:hypothetical protein